MLYRLREIRFSLLTLFGLITLCGVLGGTVAWRMKRLRQRAAAIAELQMSGAEVSLDLGPLALNSISFVAAVSDRQINLAEQLGKLDALSLPVTDLSDRDIERLCRSEPSFLEISGGALSDASLDRIAAIRGLEQLWLRGVQFNGKRKVAFARPDGLRCFATTEPTVDDEFMRSFEACVNLDELLVEGTGITDRGLEALYRLRGPMQLSLKKSRISADGIVGLLRAVYAKPYPGSWRRRIMVQLQGIDFEATDVRRIVQTAYDVGITPQRVRFDDRWHTAETWPEPHSAGSAQATSQIEQ